MSAPPPAWTSAPEQAYVYGRFNEAAAEDCDSADAFCSVNAVEPARLLPSSEIDRIAREGSNAWGLEFRITDPSFTRRCTFQGAIDSTGIVTKVETTEGCQDCCLVSNLPLISGLYCRQRAGVYYEVTIHKMNGVVALGTVCRPYPHFRLPGWHRSSAALHLDDMRKFYDNSDGGQESGYWESIKAGDTVGCGYEFRTGGTLFFTLNGRRLVPDAFKGLYVGDDCDAYAAVGVDGENTFTVNFGGDFFRWLPANEWGWRLDGHVGKLEDLPAYVA